MSRRRFILGLALLGGLAVGSFWFFDPRVGRLWLTTASVAAAACLIALPLGTLLALAISKANVPGRAAAAWLLTAMLFVPLYLIAGAWDAGFGLQGWHTLATNPHLAQEPWLAGWRAAVWVHGLAAVPWTALIVAAGLRTVEAEIEEDAALVASPPRVLWHVSLPRAAPPLAIAAAWTAIVVAAEISVTDFFQVRTFAEEVYTQAALGTFDFAGPSSQIAATGRVAGEPPTSATFSAAGLWIGSLLVAAVGLLMLVSVQRYFADFGDTSHRRAWFWRMGSARWAAAMLMWTVILLVAGVPLVNFLVKAGVHVTMTEAGRDRSWSAAKAAERIARAPLEHAGELAQSATIGVAAATAAFAIGIPLAWSMRASRRPPVVRLALLALCLTVPGPVLGIGIIRILNQPPDSALGPLAALYDSAFAPGLAQTIRALPVVTLLLWPALASIPQATLDAAATERAGWWRRLLWIALPQRWHALAAAWLIGLAIAVGELAATVLVMPPARHTVVSIRVFQLLHYGVDDRVAALCLIMVALVATLTAIAAYLVKRTTYGKL